MAKTKPYRVIKIHRLPGRSLTHTSPEGLLVAHLGISDSVEYCGGVLLGQASKAHPVQALDATLSAEQFDRILETGQFCIEIPSENFLSEVITEKLRRVPPQDRVGLLAELMQQKDIPRVLVVHVVAQGATDAD